MNNGSSISENKDDTHSPAKAALRFTSVNSVNRKHGSSEDVLKFAKQTITSISSRSTILNDAFSYEFDIFKFVSYTDRPLLVLGVYLLTNSNVFSNLFNHDKVNIKSCANFLNLCEKLYQKNPYHNNIHAADVMQFNMLLLQSSYICHHFEDYECLASFMSAVAHDIGHIGKNNDFLVKSGHELALKYDNISCLENYHIEQFHQTLIGGELKANWIKNFGPKTQEYIIDLVEYAILGTDMGAYHNTIKKELEQNYTKQFVIDSYTKKLTVDQKKFIIRAMLHLSDISNPTRPFDIAKEWADRVNQEFFNQGDVMKKLNLEVSMGCDRDKTDVLKNQNGFVEYCIKPLTLYCYEMIKELNWCLKSIEINKEKWVQFFNNKKNKNNNINDSNRNNQSPVSNSTDATSTSASLSQISNVSNTNSNDFE